MSVYNALKTNFTLKVNSGIYFLFPLHRVELSARYSKVNIHPDPSSSTTNTTPNTDSVVERKRNLETNLERGQTLGQSSLWTSRSQGNGYSLSFVVQSSSQ